MGLLTVTLLVGIGVVAHSPLTTAAKATGHGCAKAAKAVVHVIHPAPQPPQK